VKCEKLGITIERRENGGGTGLMDAGISGDFMQINDIDFDPLEGLLVGSKTDREDIERIVHTYFNENDIQMVLGAK